ncbi:restriction endonuclease subunit S [Abyssicoccus albus]|uniref:Type I restriction modification DNA specificity protein n=1 Tax=Abyssicoccus albus TaxID=1817405 RepID=A0A3N5CDI9_9BACL|nr:restriction endonuclease subunit S [Abyssicoccus albus]RPF55171.1 type I restriction modification DNA specificity protein [Abyssicoccus albus]
MLLQDCVVFEGGINVNRVIEYDDKGLVYNVYHHHSFLYDCGEINANSIEVNTVRIQDDAKVKVVHEGDIIVNLSRGYCTRVSRVNDGYLLPYNYSKVVVPDAIDDCFFVAWFNHSWEVSTQLNQLRKSQHKKMKLTHQALDDFEISLPLLEYQQHIGNMYKLLINTKRQEQERIAQDELGIKVALNKL